MPIASRPRRISGLLAAAVAGGVVLGAATPALSAADTRTVRVPATLHTEWQRDDSHEIFSNCTALALVRWKARKDAIVRSPRTVVYTDGGDRRFRTISEPFHDDIRSGGSRRFLAPQGYHQLQVGVSARSVPGEPADCSDLEATLRRQFGAVHVRVEVAKRETRPRHRVASVGRYGRSGGKRRLNRKGSNRLELRGVVYLTGGTRPKLARSPVLVQRRITVTDAEGRRTTRWTTVRRVRTRADGTYRALYRADAYGDHVIRVAVDATATRRASHGPAYTLSVLR